MKYVSFFILTLWSVIACAPDKSPSIEDMKSMTEEELFYSDYSAPQDKWGFINAQGQFVIKNTYDGAREFEEGLAPVCKNGKWGYIDQKNNAVIPFQYRAAFGFHNNIARVQNFDKQYFYINKNNKVLIDTIYTEAYDYTYGLARVRTREGYNYLNTNGERLLDNGYLKANNFVDGYAKVSNGRQYGLIDTTGKVVVPIQYKNIKKPYQNIIRASSENGIVLINPNSESEVITEFQDISAFVDNKAFAKTKENVWVQITPSGKQLKALSTEITKVQYAQENKWRIYNGSAYALMDNGGNILTPFRYSTLFNARESRMGFEENGLWGYIDVQGREVVPAQYPLIWDYYEGMARVIMRRGVGFIDTAGNEVIPPIYIEVRDFHEGLARVQVFE